MNNVEFSAQIEANFHVYRIHGEGGDETMGIEPDLGTPGRALFNSPGGKDIVTVCDSLDQAVDLTVTYTDTEPSTSVQEDRLGYGGRLWSRCEETSATLGGEIFLRNDLEELSERGSVQIGRLIPGHYGVRLLTRATTAESEPPAQHIIRVWPIDSALPWRTARAGYVPTDEATWDES